MKSGQCALHAQVMSDEKVALRYLNSATISTAQLSTKTELEVTLLSFLLLPISIAFILVLLSVNLL